jgi:hypothetical protein
MSFYNEVKKRLTQLSINFCFVMSLVLVTLIQYITKMIEGKTKMRKKFET